MLKTCFSGCMGCMEVKHSIQPPHYRHSDDEVVKQGDHGSELFIIRSGEVTVLVSKVRDMFVFPI